ncbi:MAG: energy transducer TonB [Candidatus Melainabacteria bacterium]|nr:energy transducer TonB [Candidatus Melainabacteria bacterium]
MIYIWTIVILLSSTWLSAQAYYKRVSTAELRRFHSYEAESTSRRYAERIADEIHDHWDPLKSVKAKRAVFYFTVRPSGHIQDVKIKQSSGNRYYDMACKRALMSASPLKEPDYSKRLAIEFESHKTKSIKPLSALRSLF